MFARFSRRKKNWAIHTSAALAWQRGVGAVIYTGSVYYALHISVDTPGATPCLELYMKRVYASVFLPAQANHHLLCYPPTQTHMSVRVPSLSQHSQTLSFLMLNGH